MKKITDNFLDDLLNLGKFLLRFSRVERITSHEDGKRPETDSDHTVMTGVIACAFAEQFAPKLDIGKIAQYAFVHDLVEGYAGDTPNFHSQDSKLLKAKEKKEQKAKERITKEFKGSFPWIIDMIHKYEKLEEPEARFIKAIDKSMPKINNILNLGESYKKFNKTKKEIKENLNTQNSFMIENYAHDLPMTTDLHKALTEKLLKEVEW